MVRGLPGLLCRGLVVFVLLGVGFYVNGAEELVVRGNAMHLMSSSHL